MWSTFPVGHQETDTILLAASGCFGRVVGWQPASSTRFGLSNAVSGWVERDPILHASVAQLEERPFEKRKVAGSNPALGTMLG